MQKNAKRCQEDPLLKQWIKKNNIQKLLKVWKLLLLLYLGLLNRNRYILPGILIFNNFLTFQSSKILSWQYIRNVCGKTNGTFGGHRNSLDSQGIGPYTRIRNHNDCISPIYGHHFPHNVLVRQGTDWRIQVITEKLTNQLCLENLICVVWRSWRSLAAVRKRHVRVSLQTEKLNVGIVSQKDMALTQFGFVG